MDGNLVPQGINTYTESDLTRFRKLGRDSFKSYFKINTDYLDFIKNVTRFYSIDLPQNINEYLIRLDTAPFLWISDIPTIIKTEDYFSNLNKGSGSKQYYRDLKKYYTRWVTQKSERDKQYYTMSALNLIEKDPVKNHVLKKILHANIISFNTRQVAHEKAIQLLEDADRILEKTALPQSVKEELHYLIQLYSGFVYYKVGDFINAQNTFESATFSKHSGISALFYNALSNIKLTNFDSAANLISHVLDYDKERFKFAIHHRSINLLDFFLRNAITYSIFQEDDFVLVMNDIEQTLLLRLSYNVEILRQLILNIESLNKLKLKEYITEPISKQLEFLERVSAQYSENTNLLTSLIVKQIVHEFEATLDKIVENARTKYLAQMAEETKYFDKQISDYQQRIISLEEKLTNGNEDLEEILQQQIKRIESDVDKMINDIENKLDNIDDNTKFNPGASFKNSMIYNAIISMIVFMITGFAGGFMDNAQHYQNFSLVLTATIAAGIKWGGLSYLVGTLVSLITAASTLVERTNEKQRLLKQITYIKNLGEKRKNEINAEVKAQIAITEKGFRSQIERLKNSIETTTIEKEEYQEELEIKVQEKVNKLQERLLPLYLG